MVQGVHTATFNLEVLLEFGLRLAQHFMRRLAVMIMCRKRLQ